MKQTKPIKLLLLATLSILCLSLSAQNINLNLRNVTVKTAMETLRNDYGYLFLFDTDDVNTQKVITIRERNLTADQAVKQILQGQDTEFEINDKNIVVRKKTTAPGAVPTGANSGTPVNVTETSGTTATGGTTQQRQPAQSGQITVIGTVVDGNTRETLPFVTVMVKGTSTGTVTSMDGVFSINVPSNESVLTFSFMGYETLEMPIPVGGGVFRC
jgi:hypothetical protein